MSAGLSRLGLGAGSTRPPHLATVPFVATDPGGAGDPARLHRARVLQCALSRVCGVCAQTLDHPLHLVGTVAEADDNAYRLPPVHAACVADVVAVLTAGDGDALGHPGAPDRQWVVVTTGGFDLVRPTTRTGLHLFRPNAVVERRAI
ncbi:MAG TPA: hypothetical protein VGE77_00495 [Nocardioides sp.]